MPKKNITKWNINSMQDYCDKNFKGYTVIETKWKELKYQKQLWALIQCPNNEHIPTWYWWNNFKRGCLCKQCYIEDKKLTIWDSEKVTEFYKSYDLEILDITQWINVDKRISCVDNDGFKYTCSISSLKQYGKSSFRFNVNNPYSIENINHFCKLYRPEYELISNVYKGIKESYLWKYNGEFYNSIEYNREFKCTADNFINGYVKHPKLTKSKLDLQVRKFLDKYNIAYEVEKTFNDCYDKKKLRFDFYIEYNNKSYCIEADGLQHIMVIEMWGGLKGFQDRIKRDKIKNNYCKENNIELIRIPQENYNYIESIIIKEFNIDTSLKYISKNSLINTKKLTSNKIEKINTTKDICNNFVNHNYDINYIDEMLNNYGIDFTKFKNYINYGHKLGFCKKIDFRESKVICIDTSEVYSTILDASNKTNIEKTNISACCRNKRKTAGGFKWMYYDDYIKLNKELTESNCENPVAFSMQ